MSDLFFAMVFAVFALLSWGLVVLCERLMGGES